MTLYLCNFYAFTRLASKMTHIVSSGTLNPAVPYHIRLRNIMLSVVHFVVCLSVCYQRDILNRNWFWWKFAHVVLVARAWSDQLWGQRVKGRGHTRRKETCKQLALTALLPTRLNAECSCCARSFGQRVTFLFIMLHEVFCHLSNTFLLWWISEQNQSQFSSLLILSGCQTYCVCIKVLALASKVQALVLALTLTLRVEGVVLALRFRP